MPFYTNYKDGWPLTWPQSWMGAVSGDKDALVKMATDDAPWADGKEKATVDSLLYDVTKAGLIEDDPTTTNWENSKNLIATGKIGAMALGSWAVPQMQDAATKAGADPATIGFMPPPFLVDGKPVSPVGGDYKLAINVNSDHKAAARAWFDWFIDESGFYDLRRRSAHGHRQPGAGQPQGLRGHRRAVPRDDPRGRSCRPSTTRPRSVWASPTTTASSSTRPAAPRRTPRSRSSRA